MIEHCQALNRSVQVVNLDPAAEHFEYPVMAGEESIHRYTHSTPSILHIISYIMTMTNTVKKKKKN